MRGFRVARAGRVQLGARLVRRLRRAATTPRAAGRRGGRSARPLTFARWRALGPARELAARAGVARGDRILADARQPGRAVGDDARGDEARRRRHPGDDAARPSRPARPHRARQRAPRRRARRRRGQVRRRPRRLHADRGRRPCPRAGSPTRTPTSAPRRSRPTARPAPPTRCCCTSPPARPRGRSSSSTPTRRIPSGTFDDVLDRPASPATCTSTSRSPGWAKHAWSQLLRALERRGDGRDLQLPALRRRARCWTSIATLRGHDVLRAADRVAHADPGRPAAALKTRLREVVGAGEPLNPEVIEQVQQAWGMTIRDGYGQTETTVQIGNSPGQPLKPGSMGRPMPGYTVVLDRPGHRRAAPTRARSASTSPAARSA